MKLTTSKTVKVEVEQYPCMHCGYDGELKIYQDRKYDTATLTCPKCDRSDRGSCSWNEDYAGCVEKIWNPYNDRKKFIEEAEEALADIPERTKRLLSKLDKLKNGLFFKAM